MIENIWREQLRSFERYAQTSYHGRRTTEDVARARWMNSLREVAQAQPPEHDTHACG